MENQERCFYKIAHITVDKCHRVPREEGLIRQRVEIDEMQLASC